MCGISTLYTILQALHAQFPWMDVFIRPMPANSCAILAACHCTPQRADRVVLESYKGSAEVVEVNVYEPTSA